MFLFSYHTFRRGQDSNLKSIHYQCIAFTEVAVNIITLQKRFVKEKFLAVYHVQGEHDRSRTCNLTEVSAKFVTLQSI